MPSSNGKHLSLATNDDPAAPYTHTAVKYNGWCCLAGVSLFNKLGFVELNYNTKTRTVFVRPQWSLLILFMLFCAIYFLPVSMCPPQAVYIDKENIFNFNKYQYAAYGETLRFNVNQATSHQTSGKLSTVLNQVFDTVSIIRYGFIDDEKLNTYINAFAASRDTNYVNHLESSSRFSLFGVKRLFFHVLSRGLTWFRDITYLSPELIGTKLSNKSNPDTIFYSTASTPNLAAKFKHNTCSALYSTQDLINVSLHTILTSLLDFFITLANKTPFISLDPLQYFPECDYYCGYHHIHQRLNHIVFPHHPEWPLYRIGRPIVNLFDNLLHLFIPVEDQIMLRATGFLHTSILRAIVTLEIPDMTHWYATNELYGRVYTPNQLQITFSHASPLGVPAPPPHQRIRGVHIEDLAAMTCTHTESLKRLLRTAESLGFFSEISPNRWENTQLSTILRRPVDKSTKKQQNDPLDAVVEYPSMAWAVMMFGNEQYAAQANLAHSIETGTPGFSAIYGDFWTYHDLSKKYYFESLEKLKNTDKFDKFDYTHLSRIQYCQKRRNASSNVHYEHKTINNDLTTSPEAKQDVRAAVAKLPHQSILSLTSSAGEVGHISTNLALPFSAAYIEFNNAMESISACTVPNISGDSDSLFQHFDTLVDIAGGKGHLIKALLRRNLQLVKSKAKSVQNVITNAIVFDLPYTYANKDTVDDINSDVTALLNDNANYAQDQRCIVVPQYQSTNLLNFIKPTIQTIIAQPAGETDKLCPSLSIQQGSFFEPNTLPKSIVINSNTILYKFFNLLYNSSLFTDFKTFMKGTNGTFDEFYNNYMNNNKEYHFHVLHNTGYMMMQILHDWNDNDSITILSNLKTAATYIPSAKAPFFTQKEHDSAELNYIFCDYALSQKDILFPGSGDYDGQFSAFVFNLIHKHCVAKQTGDENQPIQFSLTHNKKIFIIDRLIPETNESLIQNQGSFLGDLLMMNNFNNAKERNLSSFQDIVAKSQLHLNRIVPTRFMYVIVETSVY